MHTIAKGCGDVFHVESLKVQRKAEGYQSVQIRTLAHFVALYLEDVVELSQKPLFLILLFQGKRFVSGVQDQLP